MNIGTDITEATKNMKIAEPVEATGTGITEAQARAIRQQPRFSGIFPNGGKFERYIPLSGPVLHGDEIAYIEKTLAAGADGSTVLALEKEIANYMNKGFAAALSTGSAALHMALKLAAEKVYDCVSAAVVRNEGKKSVTNRQTGNTMPELENRRGGGCLSGKRVFCADFAPATLVNSVLWEGGEPVFIDVSCDDWSMDPGALEKAFAIYPDVKIVIMNHAYGFPGQAVEIKQICEAHGAILIEDAGESLGARCFSSLTGTIGDYGILDFEADRIITGLSGGVLLTNDPNSYQRAKTLASGEPWKAAWQQMTEAGYDCAMSDLTAAMLRAQLTHLEEHIEKKRKIYERYQEAFEDGGLLEMKYFDEGKEPNYRMSCAACESGIRFRETRSETGYTYTDRHGTASPMEICDALHAFGAEARPAYKPLSIQPVFQKYDLITVDGRWSGDDGWCGGNGEDRDNGQNSTVSGNHMIWSCEPVSHELFKTAICLPSDVSMTEKEQDIIIEIILSCFDEENLDREAWEEALGRIS